MAIAIRRILTFALFSLLSLSSAAAQPTSGVTRFVLDGERIYAELAFVRPDGSRHRALAYVDMGTPAMSVDDPLFHKLQLDQGRALTFRVGTMAVTVPASAVSNSHQKPRPMGTEANEAILPAGVLKAYQVVLDYQHHTLTLAQPGTLKPEGVATPFHINDETGLIAVDAVIDGKPYAVTIDNGSAWTWFRQGEVRGWLADHPAWARGVGAVGPSNMMMLGDLEVSGVLVRIPKVRIGALSLDQVDALGPGPTKAFPFELFDWYSKKNAVPVLGWIGGDVLKRYRLTIDYPNHTLYWLKQAEPDAHALDRVGLVLRRTDGYVVAGVATKDGRPTVEGVEIGDTLVRVDSLVLKGATWGAIFEALHGAPGDPRTLVLARDGKPVTVTARVTAF